MIPNVACVDVSHVNVLQRDDLRVIGTGFDADEGRMIRVFATIGDPGYGLGEAPIVGGAFDMTLPGVLADYTELGVLVDRVRNDRCDPGDETLWQQATGPLSSLGPEYPRDASGEVLWEITPDKLHTFEQAGLCNTLSRPMIAAATGARGLIRGDSWAGALGEGMVSRPRSRSLPERR